MMSENGNVNDNCMERIETMSAKKKFAGFLAVAAILAGVQALSVGVYAEAEESSTDVQVSEQQPPVQESVEEPSDVIPEPSYEEESSDIPEPSYEEESSDIPEPSYEQESSDYVEEPSPTDENPFPWAQESEYNYYEPEYSYDYSVPEESSYYYYEEESSSYDYYDYYVETTESEEEESIEESTTFQEISVDSSELTQKDWENLKNNLSSDMKLLNNNNKSNDAVIREIKENSEKSGNDAVGYLIWGIVLIGMGAAMLALIIYSTWYTKRRLSTSSDAEKPVLQVSDKKY